ncbi:oxygen-dependent coproporphyrinogen oxidase [Gammaproteobacteria bacterium]|nr:oxygen-dependent coproporphyrinogen oxidase [Gammaproteobacteria bacterium]
MNQPIPFDDVVAGFRDFQQRLCTALQAEESDGQFIVDQWQRDEGGGGRARIIEGGATYERGGVMFSDILGKSLPPSALTERHAIVGKPFRASGVSVVIHPRNPFVPTAHMNIRLFSAGDADAPVWWFGGGLDLTPYYPFDEDIVDWHRHAQAACAEVDASLYPRFKRECDDYFYLPHRDETRGVGGLFFDQINTPDFASAHRLVKATGEHFLLAYRDIVARRRHLPWQERHRAFQRYRRGRYVEFNLVYDRGTLFGLQSNGRTESILASMPPQADWRYRFEAEPGSEEARLADYLKPREWLD